MNTFRERMNEKAERMNTFPERMNEKNYE